MGEVLLFAGHPEVTDVVEVRANTAGPATEPAAAHEHEPHVLARRLSRPAAVIVSAVHRPDCELRASGEVDGGKHPGGYAAGPTVPARIFKTRRSVPDRLLRRYTHRHSTKNEAGDMASIREETVIESSADDVWEVIGDFAAGPRRMVPGTAGRC
ncbi:hypothetical protein SAMN05421854_1011577 [Amycolatopsis rubida]|uniref:Uncharacterized protein n=1 Tax=Amycolatopsis rubida TaxID=112413 RepID=A0A1I5GF21_9PSEU|nr:hypothetical protein SAMN05421854_1011577 [Amycolatopsis rubida]